jgi:hypothetical protein
MSEVDCLFIHGHVSRNKGYVWRTVSLIYFIHCGSIAGCTYTNLSGIRQVLNVASGYNAVKTRCEADANGHMTTCFTVNFSL